MGRIGFIVVLGAFVVGIIYFLISKGDSSVSKPVVIQTDEVVSDEPIILKENSDEIAVEEVGHYRVYSPEVFLETDDRKRVLFFYASWCPTCKPADEDFRENMEKIPSDTIVIRVNYNDNETDQNEKDLAQRYGVTYQHTFVQIDADGNEITKWNGGDTDELVSHIQ